MKLIGELTHKLTKYYSGVQINARFKKKKGKSIHIFCTIKRSRDTDIHGSLYSSKAVLHLYTENLNTYRVVFGVKHKQVSQL